MIKFSLICERTHGFEGWFSNSSDYDAQKKRGLVTCPVCDSHKIEKSLMTPSVSTSKGKSIAKNLVTSDAALTREHRDMMKKMREIRDHVTANAEDVGSKFSEEARKIHYGETESRGIYGKASSEDVKGLVEEGVGVLPLPELPEDKN